jgi:hypothetical protein
LNPGAAPAPTFLIAGGQRCGTTWLYQALAGHAQIFLASPPRPEPKFFVADDCLNRRDEYLRRWFAGAGAFPARGEKSVRYLEHPRAAQNIHALFPDIRLLFVLRHPAERAVSNYEYTRMHHREELDFEAALEAEPQRLARQPLGAKESTPHAYLARGQYHEMLVPYFHTFPREQLRILLYEDLFAEPAHQLARVIGFLGADPGVRPELPQRQNESPWNQVRLDRSGLQRLLARFREPNQRLATLTGLDLDHWDRPTSRLEALTEV